MVQPRFDLAAASRDGHLALRPVERQQALIERLHAARGTRLPLWTGVVLDAAAHLPGAVGASQTGHQVQGHVDAGGHAG